MCERSWQIQEGRGGELGSAEEYEFLQAPWESADVWSVKGFQNDSQGGKRGRQLKQCFGTCIPFGCPEKNELQLGWEIGKISDRVKHLCTAAFHSYHVETAQSNWEKGKQASIDSESASVTVSEVS